MGSKGKNEKIVNVLIDVALWRKVKSQAALEDKTIAEWVTEALKDKLNCKSK